MQSDTDLIPVEEAAAELGIEVKRLLGLMARGSLADPVGGVDGGQVYVYRATLRTVRARLRAVEESGA